MINQIRQTIIKDEMNQEFIKLGYEPLFVADKNSKILIIGQAPGISAQQKMMAFKDASGDRLIEWLGVTEKEFRNPKNFAILPMDFYYPGKGKTGDKPPRKEFAQKFHPLLINEMKDIQLTLLVGKYAQDFYLKTIKKKNLTENVRSFRDFLPEYFPLVHPSPLNFRWINKNPWFMSEVVVYLQKIVKEILKP